MSYQKKILYKIIGNKPIEGETKISGAKNSILPILVASSVVNGSSCLQNVPDVEDFRIMVKLLQEIGVLVNHRSGKKYEIIPTLAKNNPINIDLATEIRYSLLFLGSRLGKYGKSIVPIPGGCKLGERPFDIHIDGLKKLGSKIIVTNKHIIAKATKLKGNEINLRFPSVSGTQNIILASIFAKGVTQINNASCEPEVVDMINFLKKCGSEIVGEGTKNLEIVGNCELHGCNHSIIPDRIEVGTFLALALTTRGSIKISNCNINHVKSVLDCVRQIGGRIKTEKDRIFIEGNEVRGIDLVTNPYPEFPTDLHPIFAAMLCTSSSESTITEQVYGESRFQYLSDLRKMGAKIKQEKNKIWIKGNRKLHGENVVSTDLRGGAALVMAALVAHGETRISNAIQIERGYENYHQKLQKLGSEIERIYNC